MADNSCHYTFKDTLFFRGSFTTRVISISSDAVWCFPRLLFVKCVLCVYVMTDTKPVAVTRVTPMMSQAAFVMYR